MFFIHVALCIKSKGVPDRRSTHLLLFSACASPRTKSKGLHRGMCSKFIILLIKFSKVFAAQQVSSSLCIIQTISHQILIGRFNILLIYNCYQCTKSKGHLYIFIFIKFIQQVKEKSYKALGLLLSSNSARLVKSYEDTKS
jgi:hypothetical protein